MSARSFLRGAALLSCGAFLVSGIGFFANGVAAKAGEAWGYRGLSADAARSQFFGPRYAEALSRIEERVPPNDDYLLFDEAEGDGGDVFLRFELSPRRPRLVGRRHGAKKDVGLRRPPGFSFVVVSRDGGRPPRLVDAGLFFDGVPDDEHGREDAAIPGWLDAPTDGALLKGPLTLAGWCQEGSRPCSRVRLFFDGEEVAGEAIERFPRPDVEASVPGVISAARAGFRVHPVMPPDEAGAHEVSAIFETGDGRFRRVPARRFSWQP